MGRGVSEPIVERRGRQIDSEALPSRADGRDALRGIIVAQRLFIILATVLHRLDEVECKLSCCHRFGLGAIGLAFEPADLGFESRSLATQESKMLASLADQLYVRFVTALFKPPLERGKFAKRASVFLDCEVDTCTTSNLLPRAI
ncbi:MAG: hypothetical protein GY811_19900 [Myxococcales bacterium]|nr:hypothetical protein [Myxococcales bacterium]